jgi:hypothetical protein
MKIERAAGSQPVQSLTRSTTVPAERSSVRVAPTGSTPAQPAVIYHGTESPGGNSLLNKTGTRVYAQMLYTQQEWDEYMKVPLGMMWDIGAPSGDLRRAYDAALSHLSPELQAKDWGFSVSDGQLVVTRGSDHLSDDEIAAIHGALQGAGAEDAANAVADVAVKAIEEDRYWMYRHLGKGIGSYDVSTENFGDIVNLRTYMEDFREGNRYGLHLVNPTDYAQAYAGGGAALMEQIEAGAKQIDVPRRNVFV